MTSAISSVFFRYHRVFRHRCFLVSQGRPLFRRLVCLLQRYQAHRSRVFYRLGLVILRRNYVQEGLVLRGVVSRATTRRLVERSARANGHAFITVAHRARRTVRRVKCEAGRFGGKDANDRRRCEVFANDGHDEWGVLVAGRVEDNGDAKDAGVFCFRRISHRVSGVGLRFPFR